MRAALARGGVAVVVVPGEVFLADAPSRHDPVAIRPARPVVRPDERSLAAAAQVLNDASDVTILAGAGCAGAHDQLIALAGALQDRKSNALAVPRSSSQAASIARISSRCSRPQKVSAPITKLGTDRNSDGKPRNRPCPNRFGRNWVP